MNEVLITLDGLTWGKNNIKGWGSVFKMDPQLDQNRGQFCLYSFKTMEGSKDFELVAWSNHETYLYVLMILNACTNYPLLPTFAKNSILCIPSVFFDNFFGEFWTNTIDFILEDLLKKEKPLKAGLFFKCALPWT